MVGLLIISLVILLAIIPDAREKALELGTQLVDFVKGLFNKG